MMMIYDDDGSHFGVPRRPFWSGFGILFTPFPCKLTPCEGGSVHTCPDPSEKNRDSDAPHETCSDFSLQSLAENKCTASVAPASREMARWRNSAAAHWIYAAPGRACAGRVRDIGV